MKQKKITIKEVAQIANVSKGTVSRVLNNEAGVGDANRERIQKIMKDLNFEPNEIARGLASRRTGNIGFIIPHEAGYYLSNNYWPILLSAITKQAAQKEYHVLLSTPQVEGKIDDAYKRILKGKRVDGLIIGSELLSLKQLDFLHHQAVPFVLVGKHSHVQNNFVDIDNRGAMISLTEHVISMGAKKILFIAGPRDYPSVQERIQGFEDCVEKYQLPHTQICHSYYDVPIVDNLIHDYIITKGKPDAIISGAGDFVIQIIEACKKQKLRIPQDLHFASFDFFKYFSMMSPAITSIAQPLEEVGITAFSMLINLIKKSSQSPQPPQILPCRLIKGESCGENSSEPFNKP
ncbi:MAG: LacI family DNA-binding transcriptional regulator [Spirochaetales bacterium]|nr:LacI family DNA-binding transcriptional regulator [Spirochaetales bacterium]